MQGRVRVHNVGRVRNEWSTGHCSSWLLGGGMGIRLDRIIHVNEGFTAFFATKLDFKDLSYLFNFFYFFDAIQSEVLPTLHRQIMGGGFFFFFFFFCFWGLEI